MDEGNYEALSLRAIDSEKMLAPIVFRVDGVATSFQQEKTGFCCVNS